MGLSRNKVAVSEGAAGSPPFYGEPRYRDVWQRELRVEKPKKILLMRHKGNLSSICCLILRDRTYGESYGGVAQLGEHLPCKQGVMGSNPIISTKGKRWRRDTDANEMGS